MDFSFYSFNIVYIFNFPFVKDLNCHFLSSKNMETLLYFSKRALTKSLLNLIVTNHFYSVSWLEHFREGLPNSDFLIALFEFILLVVSQLRVLFSDWIT